MNNKHIITLFAVAMLAYQGWRVIDYMGSNLQGVTSTTRLLVSVAFLAFTEIGLLIWLHIGQPRATTDIQESVAGALIWTDFLGSMIVGLGDMIKHNVFYVVDLTALDPVLFLAPWVIVFLNIGGYIIYTQNDSEAKLEREARRLQHEEHGLEIASRRAAIREIQANKEGIARKLAPHYYNDVYDRVTGRTAAKFERGRKAKEKAQEESSLGAASSPNGRERTYNSEAEAQLETKAPAERIPRA